MRVPLKMRHLRGILRVLIWGAYRRYPRELRSIPATDCAPSERRFVYGSIQRNPCMHQTIYQ